MKLETNKALAIIKRQGIVVVMVVAFIVFGILSKIVNGVNSFATWGALMRILQQNAWLGIMAIGMTFVIINGFVVTLATMSGCRGIELIYAHNVAVASAAFRA